MLFNANDYVRVKLTPEGRRILEERFLAMSARVPGIGAFKLPKEDADGWSRWQLWDLMSTYGEHVYNGCKVPFETTIDILFPEQEADHGG